MRLTSIGETLAFNYTGPHNARTRERKPDIETAFCAHSIAVTVLAAWQGITLTWDVVAIMVVYFVQGALGLARLATTYFFKDELHLAPAEVAALSGLFTLPWVFKPLYGFLSDGLPVFGYRR